MNVNSPTTAASIAAPNFPADGEPPSSGSLPADLTEAHQAATTQSLDSGTSNDWTRIREDFVPPSDLILHWTNILLVRPPDWPCFRSDLKDIQDGLAKTGKDPALLTTALVAYINEVGTDALLSALSGLLALNDGPDGLPFDKNKLKILAASRWIECFPDDERDNVRTLIRGLR
ncbi:hypothetical protein [Pandoraea sputorum]|uniref:Uncharacterized protein n=1 Tax=Pandoraea sputorum TaxID=93222 RepID=A0A5E5BFZ0_9BURK|nr:hypothetical protein [Pandoraea sputorum]VVE84166.1 hypothetical protein PSP31121_04631 [Pandoraea sputorum]